MGNELTKMGGNVLSKEKISVFVHDVAGLEQNIFTLEKTAEELEQTKLKMEKDVFEEYDSAVQSLDYAFEQAGTAQDEQNYARLLLESSRKRSAEIQQNIDVLKSNSSCPETYPEEPKRPQSPDGYFWAVFATIIGPIIFAIMAVIAVEIIVGIIDIISFLFGSPLSLLYNDLSIWLGVFGGAAGFVVALAKCIKEIIEIKWQKDEYKRYFHKLSKYEEEKELYALLSDYKSRLNQENKQMSDFENRIMKWESEFSYWDKEVRKREEACVESKKKKENLPFQIEIFDRSIVFLNEKVSKLKDYRQKLYSLNIVPPDYRALDCMLQFDQIFRNDLADTMREAVTIYEERVFRGEVIRGIDKIYDKLSELAETMANIQKILYRIKKEIHLMRDDVCSMATNMDSLQKIQKENNRLQARQLNVLKESNLLSQSMIEENRHIQEESLHQQEILLSETRAARYATEALQKTQERCEWYMNYNFWNK